MLTSRVSFDALQINRTLKKGRMHGMINIIDYKILNIISHIWRDTYGYFRQKFSRIDF